MTVFVGEDALTGLLGQVKSDVGGDLSLSGMTLKLLAVDGTELASVTIPEQSADVSDKVSKSGDTMTGMLVVENAIRGKANGMDVAAASLASAQYHVIGVVDANDQYAAFLQAAEYTDGSTQISLAARRYNNGVNRDNAVNLKVAPDGTRTVSVSDAAVWRDALGLAPTVLYEHSTGAGTNSAVALDKSVASYARIRVHYKDNHGVFCGSQDFYGLAADGVLVLSQIEATSNSGTTVRRAKYTVSSDGKTLTPSYGGYYQIAHSTKTISVASTDGTNYVRIYRVEGYSY